MKKSTFLIILGTSLVINIVLFIATGSPVMEQLFRQDSFNGDFVFVTLGLAVVFAALPVAEITFDKRISMGYKCAEEIVRQNAYSFINDILVGFMEEALFRWLLFFPQVVIYQAVGLNLVVSLLMASIITAILSATAYPQQKGVLMVKNIIFGLMMNFLSLGMGVIAAVVVHILHNWLIQVALIRKAKKLI